MQKTFAIGCKNCANRLYALAKYKSMPIGLARKESDFGSTYKAYGDRVGGVVLPSADAAAQSDIHPNATSLVVRTKRW